MNFVQCAAYFNLIISLFILNISYAYCLLSADLLSLAVIQTVADSYYNNSEVICMKPEIKLKCTHRPAGRCCVPELLSSYASACAYTATNTPYFCHHHFDSSSFLYRFISDIGSYIHISG